MIDNRRIRPARLGQKAEGICCNRNLINTPDRTSERPPRGGLSDAWSDHVFLTSAVAPYLLTETVGNSHVHHRNSRCGYRPE